MPSADRVFGADDLGALFPDDALLTVAPWPRVVRPLRDAADRELLQALVSEPPRADQFVDVDPRLLRSSQPSITRAGVAYYLDRDEYRRSGRTYAQQFSAANKYPVVHERGGDRVLLGGHHRAAAALLAGTPLRVRLLQADWSVDSPAASVVTPSLFAGGRPPEPRHQLAADAYALEIWVNLGATAWLESGDEAQIRAAFFELAVGGEEWVTHQLHYARTGRIRPVEPWPDEFHTFFGCRI